MKNENIIFYAFRYVLGRKTYAVSEVVEHLINNWGNLKTETQYQIKKEILIAIKEDKAGMEMDVEEWKKILELKI